VTQATPNDGNTSTRATHSALLATLTLVWSLTCLGCMPLVVVDTGDWGGDGDGEGATETELETAEPSRPDMGGCERLDIAEIECSEQGCSGRWVGTESWSPAMSADIIGTLPEYDLATVWACEPDPDVDVCVIIDGVDHVACLRMFDGWGVSVAPVCSGLDGLDVGCGMVAGTH